MVEGLLATAHTMVTREISIVYWGVIIFVTFFLFWRSVRKSTSYVGDGRDVEEIEADVRRWGFKVFDVIMLSAIGAVLIARLTSIIAHPEVFQDARWFWIPYEKIDGEVKLFASLPWRFFRVWDAPLPHVSMILGWLLSLIGVSKMLRVPWNFLSNAVSEVFFLILVALEVSYAVEWEAVGPLAVAAGLLLLRAVRKRSVHVKMLKGSNFYHKSVSIVWKVVTLLGLPIVSGYIAYSGKVDREFFGAILLLAVCVGIWIIAGDLWEYLTILKYGARAVLSPLPPTSLTDQGPSSSLHASWRRYAQGVPVKKSVQRGRSLPRDFSKSYRDYTTAWKRLSDKLSEFKLKSRRNETAAGRDKKDSSPISEA